MKSYSKSVLFGLMAGGIWLISGTSVQAISFTTHFTGALSGSDFSKGDIMLDAIEYDGMMRSDFALVESATIVSNDLWTGGNTGAASADMGDLATIGLKEERVGNDGVVAALGNLNLNSIIDTEDKGNFAIDLFFDSMVDTVALWERGMNSRMDVQALDANGNLVGNLLALENSSNWDYAGYNINTLEIGGSQQVGSLGLGLDDFGVTGAIAGIRVISEGRPYNGPDWKVMGLASGDVESESIPEPAALGGLALLVGFVASRRRQPINA